MRGPRLAGTAPNAVVAGLSARTEIWQCLHQPVPGAAFTIHPPFQGELCKGAVCLDLACSALGITPPDASLWPRMACVPPPVYASTRATLVKALGLGGKTSAADL